MTYRLIKKEEVLALWADVPVKAMKVLKRLLREREAYRSLAVKFCPLDDSRCPEVEKFTEAFVDEKARRILEKGEE